MTSSKVLFYISLAFIGGIFLESMVIMPQMLIWGIFISGLVSLIMSGFIKRIEPVFGLCILFILIGILRVQIDEFVMQQDSLLQLNDKEAVVIKGFIADEPDVRESSQILKVKIDHTMILVTIQRYPEYRYLDEITLSGKLKTPVIDNSFNYKNYLMKDHIYSVMAFPKIKVEGKKKDNFFENVHASILWLKQSLRSSIENLYLPPESFVLKAMILGDKGALSNDLKEKLSFSGLSHIVAISGTHIVILAALLMYFLLGVGLNRNNSFYLITLLLTLYIILVGLPSSGVRSLIMAIAYLVGQQFGRQPSNPRIVFLTAAAMLMQNPLLLVYDIGFQLSFLAVLGLIYLNPLITSVFEAALKKFFKIKGQEKFKVILSMLSITLAAELFTLPVIIYNFGNIPFFAPASNILVLPVIPLMMVLGFVSSLVGMVSSVIGWLIALPCDMITAYFIFIVELFSNSWSYKVIDNVSWIWILVAYSLLIFLIRFFNRKYRAR